MRWFCTGTTFEELVCKKANPATSLIVSKELYVKSTHYSRRSIAANHNSNPLIRFSHRPSIIKASKTWSSYIQRYASVLSQPTDVLSSYEFKSGLGFYKSTRDAATHSLIKLISCTYVLYDISK
jgi:hypothetical protein